MAATWRLRNPRCMRPPVCQHGGRRSTDQATNIALAFTIGCGMIQLGLINEFINGIQSLYFYGRNTITDSRHFRFTVQ